MAETIIEQEAPARPIAASHRRAQDAEAEDIARDLAVMEQIEALAQSLPKRSEGRSPTPQEIREMAYEEREAALL